MNAPDFPTPLFTLSQLEGWLDDHPARSLIGCPHHAHWCPMSHFLSFLYPKWSFEVGTGLALAVTKAEEERKSKIVTLPDYAEELITLLCILTKCDSARWVTTGQMRRVLDRVKEEFLGSGGKGCQTAPSCSSVSRQDEG